MEEKVLRFIKQNNLITEHSSVLAAISGGPDSVALLHILQKYKEMLHINVTAITIDHNLRGKASQEDVEFVQTLCSDWGIPCIVKSVDVHSYKRKHKAGTQLAARELRYQAFAEEMAAGNYDYLAFGHHGDDQIETILMALIKNAHSSNLTGIPLRRDFSRGEIIRPLLCTGKEEIKFYLAECEIPYKDDASNFTRTYTRNRLRLDVIPLLEQENPNLRMTIQELANTLTEDEAYLEKQAQTAFRETVKLNEKGDKASIYISSLNQYPVSLQRRVFRLTLNYLYGKLLPQLTYKHEEILFDLLSQLHNRVVDLPLGLKADRSYEMIYLYFQGETEACTYVLEDIHTIIKLPDQTTISSEHLMKPEMDIENDPDSYLIPAGLDTFPLVIRTRRQGDRMTYNGLEGTKKIKDIFIDEKVPRHLRDSWPILTDQTGDILWLAGLRKNTKHFSVLESDSFIRIKWKKE